MGGKSSKIAGAAGSTVTRKYPIRTPTQFPSSQVSSTSDPSSVSPETGPAVSPKAQTEFSKTEGIVPRSMQIRRRQLTTVAFRQDAADLDFANMLKTVGVVQIPDSARNCDLAGVVRAHTVLH